MPDTSVEPIAAAMPITDAIPIGAHVSVPVRLRDGAIYGMFCCLGPHADKTLNDRDLQVMRCFADMAAFEVDQRREITSDRAEKQREIEAIIANRRIEIHYQPIWDVTVDQVVGYEALSRFQVAGDARAPDAWFAMAHGIGRGVDLEIHAIAMALEGFARLPANSYLTVNCSPSTAINADLTAVLRAAPLDRLVLEITEHENIAHVHTLIEALDPLRRDGLRIAVDDAGSGFSGLQQILELTPEIIKLDRFFVRSIETDPSRRAMASALAAFAQSVGCAIIAEGVETRAELQTLEDLGFRKVQGYLLGKPCRIDDLVRAQKM
jgi:EAL domain-containing protein (putative c-di-GMP-specific phosphodiesterase class I)